MMDSALAKHTVIMTELGDFHERFLRAAISPIGFKDFKSAEAAEYLPRLCRYRDALRPYTESVKANTEMIVRMASFADGALDALGDLAPKKAAAKKRASSKPKK